MHIEDLLAGILETNKQILAALASGAQIAAAAAPEEAETRGKRGRPRKEETAPETKAETKAETKVETKAEAKTETKVETKTESAGVTWDDAVKKLREVAQHPEHGSDAVRSLIKELDPSADSVPALKNKGLEAKIFERCEALLNPAAAGAAGARCFPL